MSLSPSAQRTAGRPPSTGGSSTTPSPRCSTTGSCLQRIAAISESRALISLKAQRPRLAWSEVEQQAKRAVEVLAILATDRTSVSSLADPEREGQEYLASLREHHAVPFLQPLTDIHLRSHLPEEMQPNGDINYVYLMAVIAVLSCWWPSSTSSTCPPPNRANAARKSACARPWAPIGCHCLYSP